MNRHDINIITAEDTSFGIYVHYHPSELVRTRDHGSEAEYSEMTVEGVYYSDTDRPISEEHSKRLPYFGKEWLDVAELDWTRPASEAMIEFERKANDGGKLITYLFYRDAGFYFVDLKGDDDAVKNALCNIGTIKVEDVNGRLVWSKNGKWIPVDEKIPEFDKYVLVTNGISITESYLTENGWWFPEFADWCTDEVTHWMDYIELPESQKS